MPARKGARKSTSSKTSGGRGTKPSGTRSSPSGPAKGPRSSSTGAGSKGGSIPGAVDQSGTQPGGSRAS